MAKAMNGDESWHVDQSVSALYEQFGVSIAQSIEFYKKKICRVQSQYGIALTQNGI